MVSSGDFQRLIDFPYLKSSKELDEFTTFVTDLNIKKIQGKHSISGELLL
jgi:hypothetical protein